MVSLECQVKKESIYYRFPFYEFVDHLLVFGISLIFRFLRSLCLYHLNSLIFSFFHLVFIIKPVYKSHERNFTLGDCTNLLCVLNFSLVF